MSLKVLSSIYSTCMLDSGLFKELTVAVTLYSIDLIYSVSYVVLAYSLL